MCLSLVIDRGKNANSDRLFFGASKSLKMVTAAKKLKDTWPFEECCDKPRQHIKKKRYHFANKGPYRQSYGFSSSHVQM